MRAHQLLTAIGLAAALPATAFATDRVSVGDEAHGAKLYGKECAACHGADGGGGRSGVSLRDSSAMNTILDARMIQMIKTGKGFKRPDEHKFGKKLSFLDTWDVVAHVRTLHMGLVDFFPDASRYLAKPYKIDKFGVERIEAALGKKPDELSAPVFTFFDFEGEQGGLRYVPQDPILLDQLKKKFKSGYLVFLPFKGVGEIGVAMDRTGKITRVAVHGSAKNADQLNKQLSRFTGQGKKGQKKPFKVGGGKSMKGLNTKIFATYLRAMETVTMYDRDERERTWADEE